MCEMFRSSVRCSTGGGTRPFHTIWILATRVQQSSRREEQAPRQKRARSVLRNRASGRVNRRTLQIDRASRQLERHQPDNVWRDHCPQQRKRGWSTKRPYCIIQQTQVVLPHDRSTVNASG